MDHYDVMQVCLSGHVINDRFLANPTPGEKFCEICGNNTITTCPACDTPIRGVHIREGIYSVKPKIKNPLGYCHECGKPFPWHRQNILERYKDANKDPLSSLTLIANRFPQVAQQLQMRYSEEALFQLRDARDVQNLFHALLQIFFNHIDQIENVSGNSGVGSGTDLLLFNQRIVVMCNLAGPMLRGSELFERLKTHIRHYEAYGECLLYFLRLPVGLTTYPSHDRFPE